MAQAIALAGPKLGVAASTFHFLRCYTCLSTRSNFMHMLCGWDSNSLIQVSEAALDLVHFS